MIRYLGKCLIVEEENERVLALGDAHLSYGREEEAYGVILNKRLFEETIKELNIVFSKAGKIDKIILLGDLKHSFSEPSKENRYDLVNFLDYLENKAGKIKIFRTISGLL